LGGHLADSVLRCQRHAGMQEAFPEKAESFQVNPASKV
jgi:hypothetical protein